MLLVSFAHAASVTLNPGDDVVTLTASLGAGDEIVFSAGTYTIEGTASWSGVGTADAPIVLRGDGDVVIETTAGWAVATIEDAAFIEVRGLTFRAAEGNTGAGGLYVSNSSDVTITDVEIGPTAYWGLRLDGNVTRARIERVHVHDAEGGDGIYAGCGDASCWTQESVFANNWVHDVAGYGIELGPGGQANEIVDNVVYRVAGWALVTQSTEYGPQNVVERNVAWEFGEGGLYCGGAAVVRNNVLFNGAEYGMMLDADSEGIADMVASHNTIADVDGWGLQVHDWAGHTGMVLANNVIANPTGYALYFDDAGYDADSLLTNNVVTGLVDNAEGYAGNTVAFVPGGGYTDFADAEAWDFYPSSGSALLDAGDPRSEAWVPATDFNGAPRDGDAPDAGAYEWAGGDNPGWALSEGFKDVDAYAGAEAEVQGGCCAKKDAGAGEAALLLFGVGQVFRRRRERR
ncbi:MAG: right-handed parallel beta-helix repeat-containing protein [Myxococcota bacterium]